MYPKNSATPPRISIGAVVQISDGAVQTAGCSVTVTPEGGSEAAGQGTLEYLSTGGVWAYTPTQGETNYTAFIVIVYKSGCFPIEKTVVTTASATAGKASLNAADVSGNLPADAKAWNGGALPTIGTSNYDGTDTTGTTTLLERLSAARSGYLDNLNVGGLVASQADIAGITQAQRVRVLPPSLMERPDSDSLAYRVWIYVYNEQHQAEDLDSAPTVTAENNAGTDRSSNLGTVTKPGGTTGQYYVDYTVASDHAIEQLVFKVAATEGTVTTNYAAPSIVVATTAVDFTATDRSNLEAIKNKLPSKGYLTGTNNSDGDVQLDEATGTVARVTLVDTCTTNSDMRGTDGANTATPLDATATQAACTASLTAYTVPTTSAMNLRTLPNGSYATTGHANLITTYIERVKAKTDNLPAEPAAVGSVMTVSDKTGYKLAADGLDSITATEPIGKPTTFRGWLMWLVQRFRRANKSATEIEILTEAGATVTTQTITSDGDDETLGAPSGS
jgi:hypothetical protein